MKPINVFIKTRSMRCVALLLAVLCGVPSASGDLLHNGLVAYWNLDEGDGDVAGDEFGSEADIGQLREEPSWMDPDDAILGNSALYFEGYNDVLVTDSMDLEVTTNEVTVSAWFNTELLPAELTEGFAGIYDSAQDAYILYLDRGSNELRFKVTDNNGTAERPGVPASMLTAEEWHHVMGVYDGPNESAKIYFDGELVDVHTNAALVDPVRLGQIAGIGSNPTDDSLGVYYFQGAIDDVAVWNRSLGRGEAMYLYNDGLGNAIGAANPDIAFLPDRPPVEPVQPTVDPVIHYSFEANLQNSGSGGATYDGTLLDTPGINEPPYGPGSVGQGLDLSENPDAITGGDAVAVDYELTDNGTIVFDYQVDKFYDFQSLWTNSVDANDWEMWIYNTGILRGRVDSDGPVSFDLNVAGGLDETYQIAFTWQRDNDTVAVELYVDGELQGEASGRWIDPGETFFIGGGDGGNDYGAGIFDEFKIYDAALTAGELLYLYSVGNVLGDFNGNGMLDTADLDEMAVGMVANDTSYDVDGDGDIDVDDRVFWVNDLATTWMGDSDFDGEFGSADLVAVFQAGKYEADVLATWAEGDWNGDQRFGSGDLVAAFQNGGYEAGPFAAELNLVPEPSGILLMLMSVLGLLGARRLERHSFAPSALI